MIDQRLLAKTLIWRSIASLLKFTIFFILTGEIKLSIGAGLIEMISKMFAYYYFEKGWRRYT